VVMFGLYVLYMAIGYWVLALMIDNDLLQTMNVSIE
jgi:hypothetical protein